MNNTLLQQSHEFNEWLNKAVLPLWLDCGLHATLGCVHKMAPKGQPLGDSVQPISAVFNFVVALAEVYMLGWHQQKIQQIIPTFFRRMADVGIASNRTNGFLHSIPQQQGTPVLYTLSDQALAATASCLSFMALKKDTDLRRAVNIVVWTDRYFARPQWGWVDQNTLPANCSFDSLLCLLETYLNLYRCSNKIKWLDRAQTLNTLITSHFYNKDGGLIFTTINIENQQVEQFGEPAWESLYARWLSAITFLMAASSANHCLVELMASLTQAIEAKIKQLPNTSTTAPIWALVETAATGFEQILIDQNHNAIWQSIVADCLHQLRLVYNAPNTQGLLPPDFSKAAKSEAFASTKGLQAMCHLAVNAQSYVQNQ